MPGFLGSTTIRRDELKGSTPRTFLNRLGNALKGRELLDCHGINHSVKMERSGSSGFTAKVDVEHRNYGDDYGPKYELTYQITRTRSGNFVVELAGSRGADELGEAHLGAQIAFFEIVRRVAGRV